MLSGEVSLYKVVGPQVLVLYMDTQECHIQVSCIGSIKTLNMWDSPENLYMMEQNFIVDQQFQAKEEVTQ
jgi:hypothetical protein